MRHVLRALAPAALAGLLAGPVPADEPADEPAPRAIDAFVNLVLGACMAETSGTSLVPEAIDPRASGVAVAATNDDPRLGPGTLRIRVTDGVVYHDRDAGADGTCHVYADGIDAEAALELVREGLERSGLPVMPFADGTTQGASGESRRIAVYGVMVEPEAPALPLITLSYPLDRPALMTAGVRAGSVE